MVRRSVLFSPGDRPAMLRKAAETDADVICFDLEDAVSPGHKAAARRAVREVLADPAFDPDAEVCVRLTASEPLVDLDAIVGAVGGERTGGERASGERTSGDDASDIRLDSVMLPKVESAGRVDEIGAALADRGLDPAVLALVETAAGVVNAASIAAADATSALVFGAEDLAADVGAMRTAEGTEMIYARQRVVIAAAAADVQAIDTVHPDFEDEDGLAAAAETAAGFGYDGKIAIHPAQVSIINDAFTPDADRIAWAERVLAAGEDAANEERGAFEVDGEMIDAPLLEQAERVIERARDSGIR
ncbi:HpcH/HpaI aldolase/citrate lyase family protein [Halopenitus salinus]|uniref:HpcH/HpaI aldolase/citrate lyase family protein n=1 Tax=Halopenitus salinus TaxID=1198295 RepID=A0ABD5UWF6_9EURY